MLARKPVPINSGRRKYYCSYYSKNTIIRGSLDLIMDSSWTTICSYSEQGPVYGILKLTIFWSRITASLFCCRPPYRPSLIRKAVIDQNILSHQIFLVCEAAKAKLCCVFLTSHIKVAWNYSLSYKYCVRVFECFLMGLMCTTNRDLSAIGHLFTSTRVI